MQAYVSVCWIFPLPQICPSLCPPSPQLLLLAIWMSSLAPSSLSHHMWSISMISWSYLLNISHFYFNSGYFHAWLLSPWHLPSYLSAFSHLLFSNLFSIIVARVIFQKGQSNYTTFLLETFWWLPTAQGTKCKSLHMVQKLWYNIDLT